MSESIPAELRMRIKAVTNKRARFLLDSIVANGQVTSEELSRAGYNHPPRAARDVRELGIPLKTIKVKHSDGRSIGAYRLDLERAMTNQLGRQMMPKRKRDALVVAAGSKCQICGATTNLQVDHRIPYQVAGETQSDEENPFQVLDGACNRTKSWSCEHCRNWLDFKDLEVCRSCYWANPASYTHVAMKPERRAEVVWIGDELARYDQIREEAECQGQTVPEHIKQLLGTTRT